MSRVLVKYIIILIIMSGLNTVNARVIMGDAEYSYTEDVSIAKAVEYCKNLAIRNAIESFAIYIESDTKVENNITTSEKIVAKSLALVRDLVIVDKKIDKLTSTVSMTVKISIDEKEVLKLLNEKINDNSYDGIKTSSDYYYGEGVNNSRRKADKEAIKNLISYITEDLQNDFADIISDDEELYEFTESIMNTYRSSFSKCKKKVIEEDEKKVLRYIKKEDLKEMFKPRVDKIEGFLDLALKAEKQLRMNDALRYYFWALSLLRSHPDHNKLYSDKFKDQLLNIYLPEKISSIFSYISFDVISVELRNEKKIILLEAFYEDEKIYSLDFQYFFNDDWSVLNNAKRGVCYIELDKDEAQELSNIKLIVEYRYESKSKIDFELKEVIENVAQINFDNSIYDINLHNRGKTKHKKKPNKTLLKTDSLTKIKPNDSLKVNEQTLPKKEIAIEKIKDDSSCAKEMKDTLTIKLGNNNEPLKTMIIPISEEQTSGLKLEDLELCKSAIDTVIVGIKNKNFASLEGFFTVQGFKDFKKIIMYGKGTIILNEINLKGGFLNDKIIIRSIPMKFSFPNNDFNTVENIVFTFNKDKLIDIVSFSLSEIAINDIMSKPVKFGSVAEKLQIIQFMEIYKTAYCLQDLEYIKSIFAENALIIVGKVLEKGAQISEMYNKLEKNKIKYVKMSKNEYMEHLELVFRSNEFINLQFEENQIKKVNKRGKVYGIQIFQMYHSKNYADKGYLFLMMDLNDIKRPMIYVRSWQPEKNLDGSIMGLSDFKL